MYEQDLISEASDVYSIEDKVTHGAIDSDAKPKFHPKRVARRGKANQKPCKMKLKSKAKNSKKGHKITRKRCHG